MQKLSHEQEILMNLADMLIEVYTAESALLRTEKLIGIKGEKACEQQINMTKLYLHRAVEVANRAGKEAIFAFAEGDEQRMMLLGLKRFSKIEPMNLKEVRRSVADHVLEKQAYEF